MTTQLKGALLDGLEVLMDQYGNLSAISHITVGSPEMLHEMREIGWAAFGGDGRIGDTYNVYMPIPFYPKKEIFGPCDVPYDQVRTDIAAFLDRK